MAQAHFKGKTAANAILFVVFVIGALAMANVLSTRVFGRLDLTSDGVYTLSKASKDLVKNLPDRMNVKLFMSEDLKPPFSSHARFAQDLLHEYATYSGGKFNVEVIKIGEGDSKKEEEASRYKVRKVNRGVVGENKLEIGSTYLGIGFDYLSNTEAIENIENDQGLEFRISGLIKKMTAKRKKKVAFASSEGELPLGHGGLQVLSEYLKQNSYDTTQVELKANIPDDVDALFIVGPKQAMSERGKYVVDQFLMKGGKGVAFFVDGQAMQSPGNAMQPGLNIQIAQANQAAQGLEDLLAHYGAKVKQDMVLDRQAFVGPVMVDGQLMPATHPVFLMAGPLDDKHPITQRAEAVIFPYASSLELTGDAKEGKNGITAVMLAQSSKHSWRPEGPFVMDPQAKSLRISNDKGPYPLAYALTGKWKSFFAGKQAVKEDGTKVDANVSQPGSEAMITEAKDMARVLVVGDSDFISDQYVGLGLRGWQPYLGNLIFALNAVDWLVQDEALAKIRNKGMQNRPLKQLGEGTAQLVKYGNIGGVPLIVCVIGLVRWARRRSRRADASIG
jgi:gliding-associated putative ABC transporter substrate-binding component GldG